MHKVAIITRTMSREILLKRALESVVKQTFKDFLWVIVNDGGEKSPVEEIAKKAKKASIDVKVIHKKSSGGRMEAVSNEGIRSSKSDYIVIHDDDDRWHPDFLKKTVAFLENDYKYGGVVTRSIKINEELKGEVCKILNQTPHNPGLSNIHITEMCRKNLFPPISFLFRRKAFEEVGFFDEDLIVLGDWDFNLRFLEKFNIGVIPQELAYYHLRIKIDKGQEIYGNSVIYGVSKHIEYDAIFKNKYIRKDLQSGKLGLGYLMFMGKLHTSYYAAGIYSIDQHLKEIMNNLNSIKNEIPHKDCFKQKLKKMLPNDWFKKNKIAKIPVLLFNSIKLLNKLQKKLKHKLFDLLCINKFKHIIKTIKINSYFKLHYNKIKSEPQLTKYNGLMKYTYNKQTQEVGYYNPSKLNIGDYIQSLAAKQFLPHVDQYVDRDLLSKYKGKKINLIMNAWWYIWNKNKNFSKNINPLFVSCHFNNIENISEDTLLYLKEHEPIGCRDYNTRNFLLNHGIKAYFSGCLTLTFGNTYNVPIDKRDNKVLFVDYILDEEKNEHIKNTFLKILSEYVDCKTEYIQHRVPLNNNISENFKLAEYLLDKYSKAKLVITTNLHCALPCLAMHTPVVFVIPHYDHKRFNGLDNLLNIIGKAPNGDFINTVQIKNNFVVNSDKYKQYADNLSKICKEFIKK